MPPIPPKSVDRIEQRQNVLRVRLARARFTCAAGVS
jgi:hypothetical protein